MKRLQLLPIFFTLLAASCSAVSGGDLPTKTEALLKTETEKEFYIIGAGDVLEISVWKDEALTRTLAVLPDGTIHFPLLGTVHAAGKTVKTLKAEIENAIKRYVSDPVLSVDVLQTSSMVIYVIGRVQKPGRFPLTAEINVLQALAMAGGLNPYAERKQIRVFRETDGKTVIFPFNYKAVSAGEALEQNIRLKRGDTIVVP